ncbi:MAG: sulfite exporter TauE/SafE family protein [Actinobacteria bacterium]|nr:sulfite exporter TauE/SafE family protein [Actinomycetota bacterium]MBO0835328.1 sulfite exporter TauE/SafE family protein [Actinomycetota bacterium]
MGQFILSGPVLLAIPVAAAAGGVTFLSPCVLPLVPGYLSYLTGMSGTAAAGRGPAQVSAAALVAAGGPVTAKHEAVELGAGGAAAIAPQPGTSALAPVLPPRGRVMLGTLLFILGFSVLFTLEGVAAGSLGGALQREWLTRVLGGLVILLGLLFIGMFDRFSFAGRILKPGLRPKAGLAGAPVLGVLFGLGWTPCSGPTLSAVMTLSTGSGTAIRGGLLAFVYALGIGIPFLIVALAFSRGATVFGFARRHARLITIIGGMMLIVVGVLEVTGAWQAAITWLQVHWLNGYNSPI